MPYIWYTTEVWKKCCASNVRASIFLNFSPWFKNCILYHFWLKEWDSRAQFLSYGVLWWFSFELSTVKSRTLGSDAVSFLDAPSMWWYNFLMKMLIQIFPNNFNACAIFNEILWVSSPPSNMGVIVEGGEDNMVLLSVVSCLKNYLFLFGGEVTFAGKTVLGTVETISGTFLLQPSIHTKICIRNPRMQQRIII